MEEREGLEDMLMRMIEERCIAREVSKDSAEFMAGAIEYVISEILDMAGEVAKEKGEDMIVEKSIRKAVDRDLEFGILLRNTSFRGAHAKKRKSSLEHGGEAETPKKD